MPRIFSVEKFSDVNHQPVYSGLFIGCSHDGCIRQSLYRGAQLAELALRQSPTCPHCKRQFEVFNSYIEDYSKFQFIDEDRESPFELMHAYRSIGARETRFSFEIEALQTLILDLSGAGVHSDSEILNLFFQPKGDSFFVDPKEQPILLDLPKNRGPRIQVYGIPTDPALLLEGTTPVTQEIEVIAHWIPKVALQNTNHIHLAMKSLRAFDTQSSIIYANVSVESSLRSLFDNVFEYLSNKKKKDLLDKHCTYGVQLNFLLDFLVRSMRIGQMPEGLIKQLQDLKKMRDQIAHTGFTKSKVPGRKKAAELMYSALFAVHFFSGLTDLVKANPE